MDKKDKLLVADTSLKISRMSRAFVNTLEYSKDFQQLVRVGGRQKY